MVMGALGCLGAAPLIQLLPLAQVLWPGAGGSGLIPDLPGMLACSWESWDLWPGLLGMMNSSLLQTLGWELGAAVVSNLAS